MRDIAFVVGQRRIATYKCVLVARSAYFRALLSASFGGEARSEIVIGSEGEGEGEGAGAVDYESLVGVLEFVFTGTIDRFQAEARAHEAYQRRRLRREQRSRGSSSSSPLSSASSSASPLAASITTRWRGLWSTTSGKAPRAEEEEKEQTEEKEGLGGDSDDDSSESFVGRVVALLAASAQFALFDLGSLCERTLIAELARRTPPVRQQPQKERRRPGNEEKAKATEKENEDEREADDGNHDEEGEEADAADLALPLLIVADRFACAHLRSACLNVAALQADAVRRKVKEHRSEMDATLLQELFSWLTSASTTF